MPSTDQDRFKPTIKIKIILGIFGLFLFLVIIEASLRLGGFAFFLLQEYSNRQSTHQGEYCIMCLGESTTGFGGKNSWPAQLQKVLNERQKEIKFKVINKGIPGGNSALILIELKRNLDDYNPDMVITMIGINDGRLAIEFKSPDISLLETFKTYKLVKLLWLHIIAKTKGEAPRLKTEHDSWGQATEEIFKKAIGMNPHNDDAYFSLGNYYVHQLMYREADEMFKKALEINPNNDSAYCGLGICNMRRLNYQEAEVMFKKAIEINPHNEDAYNSLGSIYIQNNRLEEAESILRKAIESNPDNRIAYIELGGFYNSRKEFSKAEEVLKKVISLCPYESWAYVELEYCNQMQGKDEENIRMYQKYVSNYRKIKEVLDRRKIKLVCAQYPNCSIKPLVNIFHSEANIIFVDNEKIFKDVLKYEKYEDYFEDNFAGDFGHCTPKGNRLLAENIAEQILKEFEK